MNKKEILNSLKKRKEAFSLNGSDYIEELLDPIDLYVDSIVQIRIEFNEWNNEEGSLLVYINERIAQEEVLLRKDNIGEVLKFTKRITNAATKLQEELKELEKFTALE